MAPPAFSTPPASPPPYERSFSPSLSRADAPSCMPPPAPAAACPPRVCTREYVSSRSSKDTLSEARARSRPAQSSGGARASKRCPWGPGVGRRRPTVAPERLEECAHTRCHIWFSRLLFRLACCWPPAWSRHPSLQQRVRRLCASGCCQATTPRSFATARALLATQLHKRSAILQSSKRRYATTERFWSTLFADWDRADREAPFGRSRWPLRHRMAWSSS